MRTAVGIKNEWWQQIRVANNKKMLSDDEIRLIGLKIILKKNMPFFSADKDGFIFNEIVKKIDRQIYPALPNRLYSSMRDSSYGLSNIEAKELKKNLNIFICDNVKIPYMTLLMEKAIIKRVLDVIVDAMKKGNRL